MLRQTYRHANLLPVAMLRVRAWAILLSVCLSWR